jgi:hypothetical protein
VPLGPRKGLIAAFRQDKVLFWATVVMSLFALAPMAFATFLPLGDLPDTACFSALVPEIVFGHGLPSKVYYIKWAPMPYWGPAVLIGTISSFSNVVVAIKVVVGAVVLLIPLGVMRLMIATGRDPRVGLLAFAFSWEHSLYGGWIAYVLGMTFTLWALAWLIEVETVKGALRVALVGLVIGLTHAQATLYFVVMTIALTIARARPKPLRRLALHALTGAGLALVFLPWIFRVSSSAGSSSGTISAILTSLANTDDPLHEKLRDMFRFSFENYTRREDLVAAARTFGMLLAAPALLSLLPSRAGASRAVPLTMFLVSAAFYVILPMSLVGGPVYQWYVYPRNTAYMLMTMLLLARPDLSGRRIAWLIPGIAIVLAFHVRVMSQFSDWDKRTGPFLDLAHAVRKNSRVLPLEMDDSDPVVKWHIVNQFHAYIAALRSSYSPHMWRHPEMPYQYRPETDLPATGSVGGGNDFDLETYGPHYDYVLVQGKKNDPVQRQLETKNYRVQLLKDTEVFRLYEVHRKQAPAAAAPPPPGATRPPAGAAPRPPAKK